MTKRVADAPNRWAPRTRERKQTWRHDAYLLNRSLREYLLGWPRRKIGQRRRTTIAAIKQQATHRPWATSYRLAKEI